MHSPYETTKISYEFSNNKTFNTIIDIGQCAFLRDTGFRMDPLYKFLESLLNFFIPFFHTYPEQLDIMEIVKGHFFFFMADYM